MDCFSYTADMVEIEDQLLLYAVLSIVVDAYKKT